MSRGNDARADAMLNSEASWRAIVMKENTFLNVTFLDGEDLSETPPLRRYRSEPDFSKVWRQTEDPHVMVNELQVKKDTHEDALSGTDIESCKSCQYSSHATTITREPDSDSESFDAASTQRRVSSDEDVTIASWEDITMASWADMTEESAAVEHGDDDKCRGKNGKRIRPCKSKRLRFRKFMNKMREEVEACPETFDMDQARLPYSLFFCDKLRDRFGERMHMYQSQVLRVREQHVKNED